MTQDARFEDGGEKPLRLHVMDAADLQVLSALAQDAVFPMAEVSWNAAQRRFSLLINRFRWEDAANAEARGRAYERVQSVLVFDGVMAVRSNGVQKGEDVVLSLLSIDFAPGEDGAGQIILNLAGDGGIALDVETIEAQLRDVTRPYVAPSGAKPSHPH
ncbi:MAG: DUF2948 family protein [Planktomarina sp.]